VERIEVRVVQLDEKRFPRGQRHSFSEYDRDARCISLVNWIYFLRPGPRKLIVPCFS